MRFSRRNTEGRQAR
ncbi:unnamed protein product [Timema podura]|uniref:Uncharacterized protein n=1 Tax=Timema podura TaxID=61482 RepID=A0ABN7PP45_TIMPD|nr:unnamed protein product [Timema podura]